MPGNRKAAEQFVYNLMDGLEGGTSNSTLYRSLFKDMSNADFERWIKDLESGDSYLSIIVPNGGTFVLNTERTMKVGKAFGVEYFQRIRLTDPLTGEAHLSNKKYLVIDVPVRRQSQHLVKKMSMPENSRVIDHLTGQVTGPSKGGAISLPELLILNSKGMEYNLLELVKIRGGDNKAYRKMVESISETGSFSVEPLLNLGTKPTSTETLRALLLGIHLDNTLTKS